MNIKKNLTRFRGSVTLSLLAGFAIAMTGCGGSGTTSSSSSSTGQDMAAYENADGIRGGQLYSKFWGTDSFSLSNSNLQSQAQLDTISNNGDFFRCKQCHGWDRLGREGGYSNRAPSTTRPNIADVDLAYVSELSTPHELFDSIKNGSSRRDISEDLSSYNPAGNSAVGDQMPNFSQILTDAQIWDIVKYLKEEALDTTELYDIALGGGVYPNRSRSFNNIGGNGNASNGDTIYAAKCAMCHGDDGTSIMVDGGEYTVGAHVRAKPYEDQHKVKFGHLGSIMGPVLATYDTSDIRDLLKALTDTTKYPDTAPAVGLDGVALFEQHCGNCHTGNGMGTGRVHDVTRHPASEIKREIAAVPSMQYLSFLTDAEIEAIAEALVP